MYEMEVRHSGLGKYRYIKGRDKYVVEQKARAQQIQWDNGQPPIFGPAYS